MGRARPLATAAAAILQLNCQPQHPDRRSAASQEEFHFSGPAVIAVAPARLFAGGEHDSVRGFLDAFEAAADSLKRAGYAVGISYRNPIAVTVAGNAIRLDAHWLVANGYYFVAPQRRPHLVRRALTSPELLVALHAWERSPEWIGTLFSDSLPHPPQAIALSSWRTRTNPAYGIAEFRYYAEHVLTLDSLVSEASSSQAVWKIVDVLSLPSFDKDSFRFAGGLMCDRGGHVGGGTVFGIIRSGRGHAREAKLAWAANLYERRFEELPVRDVECLGGEDESWPTYTDSVHGYAFRYPPAYEVSVQYAGSQVSLTQGRRSSEFYVEDRPPETLGMPWDDDFRNVARAEASVACMADSPDGSQHCALLGSEDVPNRHGLRVMVQSRTLINSRTPDAPTAPVYAVDLSHHGVHLVLFVNITPDDPARAIAPDVLRQIVATMRLLPE